MNSSKKELNNLSVFKDIASSPRHNIVQPLNKQLRESKGILFHLNLGVFQLHKPAYIQITCNRSKKTNTSNLKFPQFMLLYSCTKLVVNRLTSLEANVWFSRPYPLLTTITHKPLQSYSLYGLHLQAIVTWLPWKQTWRGWKQMKAVHCLHIVIKFINGLSTTFSFYCFVINRFFKYWHGNTVKKFHLKPLKSVNFLTLDYHC